jgi:hypothetical protein
MRWTKRLGLGLGISLNCFFGGIGGSVMSGSLLPIPKQLIDPHNILQEVPICLEQAEVYKVPISPV